MKKILFAFATMLFVACGNKVQQPELVEDDISLPEYKLLVLPLFQLVGY